MGKTATKVSTKRVPFQWSKLKKLWDEGKSYLDMAKALDSHFNKDGDDPTKATRARCSIAMTKGIMLDGKRIFFKPRSKPQMTKESKATAAKQAKKPTPKPKGSRVKAQRTEVRKLAKVVPLTPSPDKTTAPTEA